MAIRDRRKERCLQSPQAMKTNRVIPLLVLLAVPAISGCQTLVPIENPSYRFRDVRPRVAIAIPLTASTIDFDFDIEVDNPNPVGIRLDRIDFDLLVNGSRLVTGISDQRIRIPARGIGSVHLRTRVGYDSIRTIFQEVANVVSGGRADYEIRGRAYYDTPVGRLEFPLTVYQSGR